MVVGKAARSNVTPSPIPRPVSCSNGEGLPLPVCRAAPIDPVTKMKNPTEKPAMTEPRIDNQAQILTKTSAQYARKSAPMPAATRTAEERRTRWEL